MKNLTLNINFNVSNPLHDQIVETSLEIRDKYGSKWYIDEDRYHLHLPMYLFEMPSKNVEALIHSAEEYLNAVKKVPIHLNSITASSSGLIMLNFEKTKEIYDYHKKALSIFNVLREGQLRDKQRASEYLKRLNEEELRLLHEYGHVYVLENFVPHITIANIKDADTVQEVINKYSDIFVGADSEIERFQIHEARFGVDDRTIPLFDRELSS